MPHWPLPVYAVEELRGASFHDPDNAPAPNVLERAYRDFFNRAASRVLSNAGSDE